MARFFYAREKPDRCVGLQQNVAAQPQRFLFLKASPAKADP